MRVHSFQSIVPILGLVAVASADYPVSSHDAVVTVIVQSTITTCPTIPPPPCSGDVSETGYGTSPPLTSSDESSASYTYSGTESSVPTDTAVSSYPSVSLAPACADYWLSNIKHQGKAPLAKSGYSVFRNVKDFGAKGDGVSDDTAAINRAISDGGRCGPGTCGSSTTTPAIVYFPPGTYLVSAPIIDYYYTQIIGDPICLPVIKASSSFQERFLIDGDQYQSTGKLGWGATNVFWRQIRNLIVDLTAVKPSVLVAGIHWPTGQATSLENIVFKMSTASGNQHQGLFIEEGSGGYVGDLVFHGGAQGLSVGNQQFTMRNLTFHNSDVAIQKLWDWGWTYKGLSINNCRVGLDITGVNNGALSVGSVVLVDSDINNTPVGIAFGSSDASGPAAANSIIVENVRLSNVPVAIQGPGKSTVLPGSSGASTIAGWGRGHKYTPTGPTAFQGAITPNARPEGLVSGSDYYERSKPKYDKSFASDFVSVRDGGAVGNGVADDTAAINEVLEAAAAAGKIVFFDAGTYVVTSTIRVPAGSRIVGEAYPVILSSGDYFANLRLPKPVVQVGTPGSVGQVEWSDMIVSTRGAQAGAILIEWNLASEGTPSGMWDVHTRIGGFAGSELQLAECAKTPDTKVTADNVAQKCIAAFMSMHITKSATGLYMENVWLWVADHDVEDKDLRQITIYAGRGLLIESTLGNIWLYGTSVEHHVLYEYQIHGSTNIVLGQIQTETAYYQPNPDATIPFPTNSTYHDPVLATGESGWGVRIVDSSDILVYGAGLYSFFDNNDVTCSNEGNTDKCQKRIFSVEGSSVSVYNLNTVGTTKMITVDGTDVASYSDNADGFVQTIALFRS
ncbi:hypothetical protein QBC33DRAFT_459731 [Phialemonium atrogriseum]|uniref:Rhamnogalacturonase A/B/Epimerase-like pectate lyase domain-containing protein n=1 Tax=Phialemonium atrogriseum TaxID=1093897 RepID=A0AAJ0BRN5_9PEZI|nr:uncharacterized protein QBC33DRAFT_459731 [Phialemonium atrogriseum]KAK1763224.1 hypothetical protein QBC33DRAFT_459731 [Phialemonium atrogriseum]